MLLFTFAIAVVKLKVAWRAKAEVRPDNVVTFLGGVTRAVEAFVPVCAIITQKQNSGTVGALDKRACDEYQLLSAIHYE